MKIIFFALISIILFSCNQKEIKKSDDQIVVVNSVNNLEKNKNSKVLTSKIIDETSDENLEQVVYDNIVETFNHDFSKELECIKKLSAGQQMFWSTLILEGEVNNGGFNQFYINSNPQIGEMAQKGFKLIHADKFADLTFRANKVYEENKTKFEAFNDGTFESLGKSYEDNPLNKLDDEFFDLDEIQNISKLRIKYIREHKIEFINR